MGCLYEKIKRIHEVERQKQVGFPISSIQLTPPLVFESIETLRTQEVKAKFNINSQNLESISATVFDMAADGLFTDGEIQSFAQFVGNPEYLLFGVYDPQEKMLIEPIAQIEISKYFANADAKFVTRMASGYDPRDRGIFADFEDLREIFASKIKEKQRIWSPDTGIKNQEIQEAYSWATSIGLNTEILMLSHKKNRSAYLTTIIGEYFSNRFSLKAGALSKMRYLNPKCVDAIEEQINGYRGSDVACLTAYEVKTPY